jgi:uncharacterized ion transporter superfamily protein YfcC
MSIVTVLTWVIPGGVYSKIMVGGREVIDPDSFKYVEAVPQNIHQLFIAPIRGFIGAAEIIAFIFIVGGAFFIIKNSGAIESLIHKIVSLQYKYHWVRLMIIPLFMLIFSFFGSLFGMSEEVIPFVLIFVPLAISLGYDSITGAAIPFVGAGVGFASAFVNPFTLGIAQEIAELPPLSGMEFRIIVWLSLTLISILFVMIYASKIAKSPEKSLVYQSDKYWRTSYSPKNENSDSTLRGKNLAVLLIFLLLIIVLIAGVLQYSWYIKEISALFLGGGILIGLVAGKKINDITLTFIGGAKEFVNVAFIIASARAILVIAEDGKIIDTILHTLASTLTGTPNIISVQIMLLVQSVINVFIPSGSGQAALIMPIMAPLSDLLGVTRQSAVLAFQMGDGLTNLMIPTSGVTMGVLGIAKIPFEKWFRWILPLMFILFLLSVIFLWLTVKIEWGPF